MRNKIIKLGALIPITLASSLAISCEHLGRRIDLTLTGTDLWLNNANIYPYVQDSIEKDGFSLDIPFFPLKQKKELGDIFVNFKSQNKFVEFVKFVENIQDTTDMTQVSIKDVKSKLGTLNKRIHIFLEEEKQKSPTSQFIAFYSKSIGDKISIFIYKLSPTQNNEYKFMDNLKNTYDFSVIHTTEDDKNKGVALRVFWPLRSVNPVNWIHEESKKDPQPWMGFVANRMGKRDNFEKEWRKNPINLMTYPFIDYKNHTLKIMIVGFKGGTMQEYDKSPFQKVKILNATSMRYKVVSVDNFLPFTKTPIEANAIQLETLKKVVFNLKNWIINVEPKTLITALRLLADTIPHIQLLLEEPEELANIMIKQFKDYKDKINGPMNVDDWNKIKITNPANLEKLVPEMAKDLKKNGHFDFGKINEIKNLSDNWKKYDTNWLKNLHREEQHILVKMLLTLKYISPKWQTLK